MTIDARTIAAALRAGDDVTNAEFDALLPPEHGGRSIAYWTPVKAAITAARWLEQGGATSVLDVGSGAGKFCTIAAIVTSLELTGVERRGHLVDAARTLAQSLGVESRTRFVAGDLDAIDLAAFDGLYLYNPFSEGNFPRGSWLDDRVAIGPDRARHDTQRMQDALASLAVGVQVVTYHGYGGRFPDSYELLHRAEYGGGNLLCWQKRREHGTGRMLDEADWS